MKTSALQRLFTAFLVLTLAGLTVSAQEIKREVHLKIVENGVVKKDTVYVSNGDSSEMEHFAEVRVHHGNNDGRQMREKQVMIIEDGDKGEMKWESKEGQQKEVKVIVHGGDGNADKDVEEIWIEKQDKDKPCHTIIIHEGDCEGGMEMDHVKVIEVSKDPMAPAHAGDKNVKVEKKVIKNEDGEKVIEVTTTVDDQPKSKPSKKK